MKSPPAAVLEAQIVNTENSQGQAHLRADRVERCVEKLFGDREVGDAHRRDPVPAPHEQCQGGLRRRNLERSGRRLFVLRAKLCRGWIDKRFDRRDLRENPGLDRVTVLIGETPTDRWRRTPPPV